PLRMDIALTYKCQNKCTHCYNEEERKVEPVEKEQWFEILKKIESVGIPHIVFTGGEPSLVPYLPELIEYAENLGLVTGLNTNGRKLKDVNFVKLLSCSGLDHIQITLESGDEQTHDRIVNENGAFKETITGIKNSLSENIFTMTNTTLTKENKDTILDLPKFVKDLGLSTFAVNSIIFSGKGAKSNSHLTKDELIPLLKELSRKTRELDLKFIWYTPTRYCELNPVEFGLGVKQCTAARLSMALEPNGDVLPCQSYYHKVGNILIDGWEDIWNSELCKKLRVPQKPFTQCEQCSDLSLCGGGCPLENDFESFTCREVLSHG
ncbi:MAG: radical SAM protein, partial [Acidobacteria bacterium]|nr:radical SAM protein [Acidobacteriota bacterium]